MGQQKIVIRESVATGIAEIAWFIESKGLIITAKKFSNDAYDFIESLANPMIVHPVCRDIERRTLGFKCSRFRKKYTVVFIETEDEIIVSEFLPSKLIK